MLENNRNKNNKTKMVQIEKTNYLVPDFLVKNFDNVPSPKDFYAGYTKSKEEIPLWWSRDVALPLTRKENRRAKKKALNILNALEIQREELEQANARFQMLLQKQEKEYQKRCELLEEQVSFKLEELKLLSENNKLEYQNKLMELELELQKANMEKDFYEKESNKLKYLEANTQRLTQEHIEWQEAVASLDEEISDSKETNEIIKANLHKGYKEKGLTEAKPVYEKEEIKKADIPLVKPKLESYDKRNILEVKHLTLTNRDTQFSELKNISFDVKRKEITIVYSNSERVLMGILSAIMRTLPSNMQITTGDIRIEGDSNAEILRDEYRKGIQKLIVSLVDVEDMIARSNKKIAKVFNQNKMSNEIMASILSAFNLDIRLVQHKLNTLDDCTKRKLAIAASLSMQLPLTIMLDPEEDMLEEEKAQLAKIINNQKGEGAILILSSDKSLVSSLRDTSFYTFNS